MWGARMREWTTCTVADIKAPIQNALATGPFGSAISSRFFVDTGVPVIRGSNLSQEISTRLIDEGLVFIAPDKAQEFSRSFARRGDLIFTCWGTIDQVGLIDSRSMFDTYIVSNKQMKLTPDPEKADSLFLYYLFSNPEVRAEIVNRGIGTSVPGFNLGQLKSIPLLLPPVDEQRTIAHILGTLDDKIELNRRTNETLEAMARAIFKSWFVDFDPVRAKANGEPPESICHRLGLTPDILDLFPDSLEESEICKIPAGWAVAPVGKLAEVVGGGTPSTKDEAFWNDGLHYWATPKDLSKLATPVLLSSERKITDKGLAQIGSGLLPPGTVLLSSRAPIGYRAITEVPIAINQGFIAMQPNPGVSRLFLLYWAEWAHQEIVSRANGSTFLEISKGSFRPIPVVTPPTSIFGAFDQLLGPIYQRMVCNEREAIALAEQRDTLLPRLLSGEIGVPVEEIMS